MAGYERGAYLRQALKRLVGCQYLPTLIIALMMPPIVLATDTPLIVHRFTRLSVVFLCTAVPGDSQVYLALAHEIARSTMDVLILRWADVRPI